MIITMLHLDGAIVASPGRVDGGTTVVTVPAIQIQMVVISPVVTVELIIKERDLCGRLLQAVIASTLTQR